MRGAVDAAVDIDQINKHLRQPVDLAVLVTRAPQGRPRHLLLAAPEWSFGIRPRPVRVPLVLPDGDAEGAANLLDAFELLPELLPQLIADDRDRSGDVVQTLQSLAQSFPKCRGTAQEFEQAVTMRCEK